MTSLRDCYSNPCPELVELDRQWASLKRKEAAIRAAYKCHMDRHREEQASAREQVFGPADTWTVRPSTPAEIDPSTVINLSDIPAVRQATERAFWQRIADLENKAIHDPEFCGECAEREYIQP